MTTWSAAGKVAATRDMLGRSGRGPPTRRITVARPERGAEPFTVPVRERWRDSEYGLGYGPAELNKAIKQQPTRDWI